MSKKYDLTVLEILQCLQRGEEPEFKEEFSGFSAEEIQQSEEKLGVVFPEFYKQYMMQYGRHPINNIQDKLCEPSEIESTYEYLLEDIDSYIEDLEGVSDEEAKKMCEENDIYRLCQLPKEDWNIITDDYILIACENQGVWNAGYLRKDLENGVQDPPVYISTNDDFITFTKAADNTEEFLKYIFFMSTWCLYDVQSFDEKDEILNTLKKNNLDIEKMTHLGVNFCNDSETNKLFVCLKDKNDTMILLTAQLT